MKICSLCKVEKDLSLFYRSYSKTRSHSARCTDCTLQVAKTRAKISSRSRSVPEKYLLSKEDFVKRSIESHPGKIFDYTYAEINGSRGAITIICSNQHTFRQTINVHMRGGDCPFCVGRSMNTSTFVEKATASPLIPEGFDYSEVDYIKSNIKVKLTCPSGHVFWQAPNGHLSGKGCPSCANILASKKSLKSLDAFISQAREVHGELFNYSKVVYLGDSEKIEISCSSGHVFWQKAGNHLRGSGCPGCQKSGYRADLKGTLYILSNTEWIKVGITNRSVEVRTKEINKSSLADFEVVFSATFDEGFVPKLIEQNILHMLSQKYARVPDVFDGSTECFVNVDVQELIQKVKSFTQSL